MSKFLILEFTYCFYQSFPLNSIFQIIFARTATFFNEILSWEGSKKALISLLEKVGVSLHSKYFESHHYSLRKQPLPKSYLKVFLDEIRTYHNFYF